MPGYTVKTSTVHIGGHDYSIRSLSDKQQFADPDGSAERAGISSAAWCLFGQLWPAARVLAEAMSVIEVDGRHILEIGCGLGLSSLVLQRRGADITASDHHPLAEPFLQHNASINALPHMAYRDAPWTAPNLSLGQFDLIIASDVLYERDHAAQLAAFLLRHASPNAQIVITDPGRGNSGPFSRAMTGQGYEMIEERSRFDENDLPPFRGRLLNYRRGSLLH
jgi:2-polyprenyl-3-methyl-5-hydroxy-6-metoxy-1,4-benzoquinol methylase